MRRLAVVVAGLALLALACGVPEDDVPQELTADDVPFELLTPTTTSAPPSQVLPPERRAELYFVDADGQVAPLVREVENQSLDAVIRALLDTDTETLPSGLTSNIAPETTLLDIQTDGEVITIDLSAEFTDPRGDRFLSAVAQIVFTATGLGEGDSVAFRQEGEPLSVQNDAGEAQDDPVSRSDYAGLLSPLAD
jgi:spore germination protein GerM